jgi:large subunit ribosomal protein L7/L12
MSSYLLWSDVQPVLAQLGKRLDAIEAQLERLSELSGVPYARPLAEVPPEIVELARAGKTIEAIKRYRELTGAALAEARDVILAL